MEDADRGAGMVAMGDAALAYALTGWPVFPVAGKVPAVRGGRGVLDASTDAEQVRTWWREHPEAGIGLACGMPSRLWVLDVDAKAPRPRKGEGETLSGSDALARLVEEHGELPATREARTGGGGRHLFWAPPSAEQLHGRRIPNTVALTLPEGPRTGLDVRSTGGYVVLPPSPHASGNCYAWVSEAPLAQAPQWLVDLVAEDPPQRRPPPALPPAPSGSRPHSYGAGVLRNATIAIMDTLPGQRHDAIRAAARNVGGWLVACGIDRAEAERLLLDAATAAGKDAREAARTIAYGLDQGAAEPYELPADRRTAPDRPWGDRSDPGPGDGDWTGPPRVSAVPEVPADLPEVPPIDDAWVESVRGGDPTLGIPEGEDPDARQPDVWHALRRKADRRDKAGDVIVEGAPTQAWANLETVITRDTRWAGRFTFDEFVGSVVLDGEIIADHHDAALALWLSRVYGLETSTTKLAEVVSTIARRSSTHPVREYLRGLTWDRYSRADDLLPVYFGAERTPLTSELGRRFLVSMVARVMRPGCKVDTTLVLVGPQGRLKSTGLRALVPRTEWFADSHLDMSSKDGPQALRGVWLYEMGELDSVRRQDLTRVKAFLSTTCDHYRPSYGHHSVDVPRQVVFAGSTNEAEFLADSTGSRRFWPVRVGRVELRDLEADRDQLWAEAVALYDAAERWWLTGKASADLVDASEQFQQSDPWEPKVREWLFSRASPFTSADVLSEAIHKKTGEQSRADAMRVSSILSAIGCTRLPRARVDGVRVMRWTKPGEVLPLFEDQPRREDWTTVGA